MKKQKLVQDSKNEATHCEREELIIRGSPL